MTDLYVWGGVLVTLILSALGIYQSGKSKGRSDEKQDAQLEDLEHAQDIRDSVSRGRADPDRLREHEGRGFRD